MQFRDSQKWSVMYPKPIRLKKLFTFVLLVCSVTLSAQYDANVDSLRQALQQQNEEEEKLQTLLHLWEGLAYTAPEEAFNYAQRGLALARKLKDEKMEASFLYRIGVNFNNYNQLDSALVFYNKARQIYQGLGLEMEARTVLDGMAIVYFYAGKYEKAHEAFQSNRDWYLKQGNLLHVAYIDIAESNIYTFEGKLELALKHALNGLQLYEAHGGDQRSVADAKNGVANAYFLQERYAKALQYYHQARATYQEIGDKYYLAQILNDIGNLHLSRNMLDSAAFYLNQSIGYSEATGAQSLHATAVANLGRVNEQKGNYKAALQQHIQALETFRQLDEKSKLIEQYHAIAEAYYKLDENDTASLYADSSLNLALNVGRWNGIEAAYLLKSNIQERLNNPRAALEFFRQAMLYRDSILNEESLKNIAEMDALYELGVKNERINSLEAENRWAKTRATGLTIGLLLVFIIGALSAGLLWMRNRKNQKIRAKEKEIEAEKIKNLDLEKKRLGERLDHLKRELSSQVLFLCQKNDLLAKVQKEIQDISLVDTANKKQLTRIVRQIDHNIESEQEWEHFMNTFVEVHPNFLKELKSNFPELTTKECRLAALFKLNLSTKEIASLLHISPDSVKKARTRFRKKLNLDSSVDLEEFLMLFPAN